MRWAPDKLALGGDGDGDVRRGLELPQPPVYTATSWREVPATVREAGTKFAVDTTEICDGGFCGCRGLT